MIIFLRNSYDSTDCSCDRNHDMRQACSRGCLKQRCFGGRLLNTEGLRDSRIGKWVVPKLLKAGRGFRVWGPGFRV